MDIFHSDMPDDVAPALPILVAKWNKEVRGILLNTNWVGINTHWHGGHTIACCGTDNCPACFVGKQWVRKYYIAGESRRDGHQAIIMITPSAAQTLVQHKRKSCGLLGMEIILGRAAKRNTAPMTGRVIATHPDVTDFGDLRLHRVMLRIFAANAGNKAA